MKVLLYVTYTIMCCIFRKIFWQKCLSKTVQTLIRPLLRSSLIALFADNHKVHSEKTNGLVQIQRGGVHYKHLVGEGCWNTHINFGKCITKTKAMSKLFKISLKHFEKMLQTKSKFNIWGYECLLSGSENQTRIKKKIFGVTKKIAKNDLF